MGVDRWGGMEMQKREVMESWRGPKMKDEEIQKWEVTKIQRWRRWGTLWEDNTQRKEVMKRPK